MAYPASTNERKRISPSLWQSKHDSPIRRERRPRRLGMADIYLSHRAA